MNALSSDDLAVWHACKTLGMVVTRRVITDITAGTGLSGTDYGVIYRLEDHGGSLGQQALTESMQLTKGAMSHQLTRMTERGLVHREKGPTGTTVLLTEHGRAMLHQARPVHARAVREHLLDRLSPQDREALLRMAALLTDR
ncbi:MarR family winged helix-turn-helix transcriptional regulator [Sphaerisporangium fuscum]|uniref:MarR family winged helix-turn-helix transcriptional regulator n=1 Tax=Sphaerisporangium fuscum TaxID=2835868 RepID=UPI001BDD0B35|nr:MarR family transcriptional regulator [Sphaerisporangium fuscum]